MAHPPPPAPPPPPPSPPHMPMVLVDRYVRFINEVAEIIEETGGPSLNLSMESVLQALPPCRSEQERENQEQRAMRKEILRYREEVQAPAYAILRERKASHPGVRKEPVAFADNYDPDYYREVLDGIEPHLLPPLAEPPSVASLALRVSWPPNHPLLSYPPGAFIASCHDNLLVLYVGSYRPGLRSPGFYLVYDTWANSVAVIPPLPSSCVSLRSHGGIGVGVAVLRDTSYKYVLVELLLRKDPRSHLTSNKATLFMWWSANSCPLAGRWIQKEVLLPFPADLLEGHTSTPTYSFRADMVFATGTHSLCWVDLLSGILVCNGFERIRFTGTTDGEPVFHFIPLPKECAIKLDPLSRSGRGKPEEYRSMCFMGGDKIRFVSMDGYSQGRPISKVMLTTWTLSGFKFLEYWESRGGTWVWEKDEKCFCIGDLWEDPFYKEDLKLQPLTPSFPVINSCLAVSDVIYLSVTDYKHKHERLEATGFYVLSLDMDLGKVTSAIKLASSSGSDVVPHPWILATQFSDYLNQTSSWDDFQSIVGRDLNWECPKGKEVADEEQSQSSSDWNLYTREWREMKQRRQTRDLNQECAMGKEEIDEGESKGSSAMGTFWGGGLGGRRVIPTPSTVLAGASAGSSEAAPSTSSSSPVGLGSLLDLSS